MTGLRWVRLDASLPANHKVLALTDRNQYRALAVYLMSLTHAGAQGTDGWIPRAALPLIHATTTHARQLVDVGLWEPCADGWNIHDWSDYQPTQDTQAARTSRARMAANIRWHGTADA